MMRNLAIALITLYRKFLSPLKGKPTCIFYPSCSLYAIRAFREWGFIRGMGMTVRRLLRCHPYSHGGYDFVPPHKCRPDRFQKEDILQRSSLPFLPADDRCAMTAQVHRRTR